MANLIPLGDYVIIKQLDAEEMTRSGLYLPESAKEKPNKGVVIAVGPGTKEVEMNVSKDEIVYYKKYAGDEFKGPDGEKLTVLRQDGIIAKEGK